MLPHQNRQVRRFERIAVVEVEEKLNGNIHTTPVFSPEFIGPA